MERRNPYSGSQASRNLNGYTESQMREAMRRQQLQRQQQQQQQQQCRNNSEKPGGFGYFLTALVGVAAGYLLKSFFYDEEEKTSKGENLNDNRSSQNSQNQFQGYSNQPSDPIDTQLEDCNDILCPITLEVMNEPLISKKCGHSFEGHAIVSWLRSKDFCPKCHAPLQQSDLVKNYSLKNAIDYMRKQAKTKDKE